VIARSTLNGFARKRVEPALQTAVQAHLDVWYRQAIKATWRNSAEVKQAIGSASIVSSKRVVFNIKGNDYRLVVEVVFQYQRVVILWLGTHREYDKIDVNEVE